MHQLSTRQGLDQLMDIYERNYSAIRVMLPSLTEWVPAQLRLLQASDAALPDVLVKLQERHAYTTDFWLSYQLSSNHKLPLYVPDFTIRVYHDAQQAEVLQGTLKDHWKIRIGEQTEAKSRYVVNHTLDRWLQLLRKQNYQLKSHISE